MLTVGRAYFLRHYWCEVGRLLIVKGGTIDLFEGWGGGKYMLGWLTVW